MTTMNKDHEWCKTWMDFFPLPKERETVDDYYERIWVKLDNFEKMEKVNRYVSLVSAQGFLAGDLKEYATQMEVASLEEIEDWVYYMSQFDDFILAWSELLNNLFGKEEDEQKRKKRQKTSI